MHLERMARVLLKRRWRLAQVAGHRWRGGCCVDARVRVGPVQVGGFERVFELGRIFRNEGVSSRHNPEVRWWGTPPWPCAQHPHRLHC